MYGGIAKRNPDTGALILGHMHLAVPTGPSGLRVTAAGIRLSTWMVQKVDTLKWISTGIVNPDDDFDSSKRFVRSRATGICIFYIFLCIFTGFAMFFDVF